MAQLAEKSTLYEVVAHEIAEDVQNGIYTSGQKVPSVRKLSKQRSVSISTVTQAYALLEDQGFLIAKPQAGYFVRDGANEPVVPPPMSLGSEPSICSKSDMIQHMLAHCNRLDMVNLGAAIPDIHFIPAKALQTYIQKVTRFNSREVFSYQFTPGHEPLRAQIARRMRYSNVRCTSEDIIVTNGCSEALNIALRATTKAGDIVAVESPCYYGFYQLADVLGLKLIEIPTDPIEGLSFEALKLALQQWDVKAVALTCRHSNPTGASIPLAKQKQIYQLCKVYDVPIIEDDIYGDLGFEGEKTHTLKALDVDGRVIYCSSFSKTIAPGLRVGWTIPGRYREKLEWLQTFNTFSAASLSQFALNAYLEGGHYDRHLRTVQAAYKENVSNFIKLIKCNFPEGTLLSEPRGGFILWICLPEKVRVVELQEKALQLGVTIVPGEVFSGTDHFKNYLRISCAVPWTEDVKNAIRSLGKMACDMAGQ